MEASIGSNSPIEGLGKNPAVSATAFFESHFAAADAKRARDAVTFADHDGDLCMLCHAYGSDKRRLFIRCFYAIDEVVPEALDISDVPGEHGYYLLICKTCRGELLGRLKDWRDQRVALRHTAKDHDGDPYYWPIEAKDADIPVRIHGMIVMMDADGYARFKAQRAAEGDAE